ncbi:MAG: HlyD family type I secretion periplasmic adaptor subunit [Aquabacterium sp.]|nr:HlyD family type I secretion periplasmic adaptor subunit [Aquabacterium sp.]
MSKQAFVTTSSVLVWSSALTLAAFVVWANWAELDQITRANGQVIASSRNQVIQAPDGGVLAALPVREGAEVRKGDVLARFDRTRTEAGYLESAAKAAALQAAVVRLTAEILDKTPAFPPELDAYPDFKATQLALFHKRRAAVREEIAALEQSRALVRAELDMNLPLLKSGDVSRAEVLKLQRQAADIQGQITNRRNKYLQEIQTDLAKNQEDLAGVLQVLTQRKEQLDQTEIRSPMDGVVRNVRLTTLGGVARPGEEIMQIVPLSDDMLIEAKVKPSEVAFVRAGLPASVKLDAYDYTVYGALPGEVVYISADTLTEEVRGSEQPYYRVQIKTHARHLVGRENQRIVIQPGMTSSVEIKTGSSTVWRYLTKPITKTLHESLGER